MKTSQMTKFTSDIFFFMYILNFTLLVILLLLEKQNYLYD